MKAKMQVLLFFLVSTLALWGITQFNLRYGETVLMNRFCPRQEAVISELKEILHGGEMERKHLSENRSLMTSARLLYLLPQQAIESRETYLERISLFLNQSCSQ